MTEGISVWREIDKICLNTLNLKFEIIYITNIYFFITKTRETPRAVVCFSAGLIVIRSKELKQQAKGCVYHQKRV